MSGASTDFHSQNISNSQLSPREAEIPDCNPNTYSSESEQILPDSVSIKPICRVYMFFFITFSHDCLIKTITKSNLSPSLSFCMLL